MPCPTLYRRLWSAGAVLGAKFEGLAGNPDVEPGELDTARGHLHALLGQVTLRPKDGVLWAYPTLKQEKPTLKESRPLILVAGARLSNYMQIKIEPFPLVA